VFWRPTSPLDGDDEEWQLECWRWLLEHFGGVDAWRQRPLILPTRDFFVAPQATGHEAALHWFGQVADRFGLDPAQFELVAQDEAIDPVLGPLQIVTNTPIDPAGTFHVTDEGALSISYSPALVANPMRLIATLAHEICHPLLLALPEEPPGGDEMEEFATDVAVTFFGFGVFNSNAGAAIRQFSDNATGTQGWQMEGTGYLSPAERAFALALFLHERPDEQREARNHLQAGALAYYTKAQKYLSANRAVAASVVAESG
jgi:hypothetical protein